MIAPTTMYQLTPLQLVFSLFDLIPSLQIRLPIRQFEKGRIRGKINLFLIFAKTFQTTLVSTQSLGSVFSMPSQSLQRQCLLLRSPKGSVFMRIKLNQQNNSMNFAWRRLITAFHCFDCLGTQQARWDLCSKPGEFPRNVTSKQPSRWRFYI